jgi:prevent-host-death family protein
MKKVTVHDAKTHLSQLLREVEAGQEIIICRGEVEVARLTGLAPAKKQPRKPDLLKGKLHLPDSFFEPLPPGYDGFPIDE